MKILDIINLSFHNLKTGGLKTALCITAVFIGVFSVCASFILSDISKSAINEEIEEIGVRGCAIYSQSGEVLELTGSQTEGLSKIEGLSGFMPFFFKMGDIRLNKTRFSALLVGADENLHRVWNVQILFGRGITREDVDNRRNVALIDIDLSNAVYKRSNTVGKSIYVTVGDRMEKFEIIGITKSQKKGLQSVLGASVPEIVYLPSSIGDGADMVAVTCFSEYSYDRVCSKVSKEMAALSGINYSYKNLDVYAESFLKIGSMVSLLASGIGAVALFVGGIGVMSNMIAASDRRRREIGIFMSLGAAKRDVLFIFLTEAVIICLLGGSAAWVVCAGVIKTLIKSFSISQMASSGAFAIASSILCGAIFGLIPALYAANLRPADSVRE